MTIKDLVRPIPGMRRASRLRQRIQFTGSATFWERRYARGGTSGPGSYGILAQGKADFLNLFVDWNNVQSIVEFGCGDGNQLSLANYPRYVGLDVSRAAICLCRQRFMGDNTKSFFLYDGACFVDNGGLFNAELVISLDVVYHLIENTVFDTYMTHLFSAGRRYVIIYATNGLIRDGAPHVLHRPFTSWVDDNCPEWRLTQVAEGPDSGPRRADFFIYERTVNKERADYMHSGDNEQN